MKCSRSLSLNTYANSSPKYPPKAIFKVNRPTQRLQYKLTKDNGETTTFVGVGLSLPIPVLTTNSGNRQYRSQKLIEAELVADQSRKKLSASRSELVNRYNKMIASLKNSLSLKALEERHEKVERQFFKGLVSSPLVIEAHRQLFDLEERRNASELEALETYGRILIMDNKFNEVVL